MLSDANIDLAGENNPMVDSPAEPVKKASPPPAIPDFNLEMQMAILNALPAHIALIDGNGAILSVNDAWRGFASTDVLQSANFVVGQNYIEVCEKAVGICGADSRNAAAGARGVLQGKLEKFAMEYLCHSSVEPIWFCLTITPVHHPVLSGAIIMHTEVTEQKRAAAALQESEMRFFRVFDHTPVGMAIVSPEGQWLRVNQTLCKMVGYSEKEMTSSSVQRITHPEDHSQDLVNARRLLVGEANANQFEKRYIHAQGHVIHVHLNTSLVRDSLDRPAYFISQVQDISEKKKSEADLKRTLQRLNEAQRIGQIGDWDLDPETGDISWSAQCFEIFGRPLHLGPPKSYSEIRQYYAHESWELMTEKVIPGTLRGHSQKYEITLVRPSGERVHAQIMAVPRRNEKGEIAGLYGTIQDISSRKHAEEERDRLFNFSLDLLCIANFDGSLEHVNPAWTRHLGWSAEELIAHPWLDFVHPEDHARTIQAGEQLIQGWEVRNFENRYRCKDGSYLWLSWNCQSLMATRQIFAVVRDISEHKNNEEKLRQNDMLQRIAARLGKMGAWAFDVAGKKVTWSDEVCIIHDVPIGHSPSLEEGIGYYTKECRETISREFYLCVTEGRPFDLELQLITAKSRRIWIRAIGEAVRDASGAIYCVEGAFQDISDRREVENNLRTSEERFHLLAKATNDVVWDWDMEKDTLWWNECFETLFGYQRSEVEPNNEAWKSRIHPEDKDAIIAKVRLALGSNDDAVIGDYRFRCKDGTYAYVMDRAHIIRNETGRAVRMIGGMTDLTERIKAEDALRESEERFRNLLKDVPSVAIQGYAMDGTVQYWNQASETMFGYTAEEAIGKNLLDLIVAPELKSSFLTDIQRVVEQGINIPHGESSLRCKDGRMIPVISSHSIVHRAGHPAELFSMAINLSERLRAEQELANTNRALQLLGRCNEALIRSETEADLLEAICQTAVDVGGFPLAWVGYSQDDDAKSILPQACAGAEQDYLSDIQLTWADEKFGQGPVGRTIRQGEATIIPDLKVDGNYLPWREKATQHGFRGIICLPLKNATRTFGVMVLYLPEVRQPLPDELRILRELAEDMAFGILNIRTRLDRQRIQNAMVKVATAVSAVSGKAFFEQLAQNMAEALGAQAGFVAQILPGEIPVARTIAAVLDGKIVENFEYSLLGTPCEAFLSQEICVIHDQVARKFPAATLLPELGIRGYVGRRLTSSTGKFLGLLFVLFRKPLEEADFIISALQIFAARVASELERQQTDAQVTNQAALLDKAQDAIYVRNMEDRITYLNKSAERLFGWKAEEAIGRHIGELRRADESKNAEAIRAIEETGEWRGEMRKTVRDDVTLILDSRWTLLRDSDGNPRGILVIDTDITDRKKIEEQFLRAQRMESIGTLAGGIAHDLNNSLTPIIMSLDLMKLKFTDPESSNLLATISASARRGADMVEQVLSFARGVEGRRIEIQIKNLLRDVEKIANETFPKNIQIKSVIPQNIWTVLGDPTQIHQVLLNLCVNARDAMPDGGLIILTAQNIQIDDHYAALNDEAKAGSYVLLQIEDTGTGMAPKILEKIFDPFFTTKEFGHGTGLGLSTSLAIIKSHSGYIRVYSEPDKGTKFKIYLPSQTAISLEALETNSELLRGNGELVLVIDDEVAVRNITRQTLEAFGYRVLLASEGSEAVGIYASRAAEIAVVLTDMMMPVLDGPATIRVLRKMNPAVRIIGASGLSTNGHAAKAASLGIKHFLPKPYTAETLLGTLRDILSK